MSIMLQISVKILVAIKPLLHIALMTSWKWSILFHQQMKFTNSKTKQSELVYHSDISNCDSDKQRSGNQADDGAFQYVKCSFVSPCGRSLWRHLRDIHRLEIKGTQGTVSKY